MLMTDLTVWSVRAHLHGLRDSWTLVLVGLVLLGVALRLVWWRRGLLSGAVFGTAELFWLAVNKPVEGPTLFRVSSRHGVTWADLLPMLMLCVLLAVTHRGRRPSTDPIDSDQVSSGR